MWRNCLIEYPPYKVWSPWKLAPRFCAPPICGYFYYDVLLKLLLYFYSYILFSLKWLSERPKHVARILSRKIYLLKKKSLLNRLKHSWGTRRLDRNKRICKIFGMIFMVMMMWRVIIADDRVQWRSFTFTLLDLQFLLSESQLFEYWYHSDETQCFLITKTNWVFQFIPRIIHNP